MNNFHFSHLPSLKKCRLHQMPKNEAEQQGKAMGKWRQRRIPVRRCRRCWLLLLLLFTWLDPLMLPFLHFGGRRPSSIYLSILSIHSIFSPYCLLIPLPSKKKKPPTNNYSRRRRRCRSLAVNKSVSFTTTTTKQSVPVPVLYGFCCCFSPLLRSLPVLTFLRV